MPIDLYLDTSSPPCRAVLMAAKELGVDINGKEIDLWTEEQNKPEFLKMNPQHCVPTINDGGFYLWESRPIMTYLANKYGPDSSLYPKDPQKRAVVDRMLYFDIGTLYQAEGDYIFGPMFSGKEFDPAKEEVYKKALVLLNGFLEKTPYVAGAKLTLADLSILASLTFMEVADYDFSPYPKIATWIARLKSELPYYEEINDKPLKALKELLKPKPE